MINNIKKIRQSKNISQTKLAELAEISRPYLSDLENSVSVPGTPIALKLAKALNCTVEDIFLHELSFMNNKTNQEVS